MTQSKLNVVSVNTQLTEIQAQVVHVLETMLTEARDGKLDGVAVVGLRKAGGVCTYAEPGLKYFELVGALEDMKFDLRQDSGLRSE